MSFLLVMKYVLLGLAGLFIGMTILVAFVYLISKAVSRGRIDAWLERLHQSKRRER